MNLIWFSFLPFHGRIFPLNLKSFSICRSCVHFSVSDQRFELVPAEIYIFLLKLFAGAVLPNEIDFTSSISSSQEVADFRFLHLSNYILLIPIRMAERRLSSCDTNNNKSRTVRENALRTHDVMRWRSLWWMLKTEKLSDFDIWHYANSLFSSSPSPFSLSAHCTKCICRSHRTALEMVIGLHICHGESVLLLRTLRCIKRSRNKHISLVVVVAKDENYSWRLCRVHKEGDGKEIHGRHRKVDGSFEIEFIANAEAITPFFYDLEMH